MAILLLMLLIVICGVAAFGVYSLCKGFFITSYKIGYYETMLNRLRPHIDDDLWKSIEEVMRK